MNDEKKDEKKDEKTTKPLIGKPQEKEEEKPRFHMDPEVDEALIRLNDAVCTWERTTGRGYTIAFVPHQRDEEFHVSVDGKPVTTRSRILDHVKRALLLRGGK